LRVYAVAILTVSLSASLSVSLSLIHTDGAKDTYFKAQARANTYLKECAYALQTYVWICSLQRMRPNDTTAFNAIPHKR